MRYIFRFIMVLFWVMCMPVILVLTWLFANTLIILWYFNTSNCIEFFSPGWWDDTMWIYESEESEWYKTDGGEWKSRIKHYYYSSPWQYIKGNKIYKVTEE